MYPIKLLKTGLVFIIFFYIVYGQNFELYLRPSTEEVAPQDSLIINLGVSEGDSIKSVSMYLDYDEDLFEFIAGESGALFQKTAFIDIHGDTLQNNAVVYLFGTLLGSGRYTSAPGSFFQLQFVALDSGEALFKVDSLLIYQVDLSRYRVQEVDSLISIVTADTFPPDPINDFKVQAGSKQLTFDWRNPTDKDFKGTVIYRSPDGFLDSISQNLSVAYDGYESGFVDQGLTNGKVYYYTAFSYDEIPNYSAPVYIKGQPRSEFIYAYPNPFNPKELAVTIKTVLPQDDIIDMVIYDATGVHVVDLLNKEELEGTVAHYYQWDGRDKAGDFVSNGVYYLFLKRSNGNNKLEKIAVLR